LVINKLTKAQYDAIQNPSETELYLVEESIDTTPTSGSDNLVTSGGVYSALQDKENKIDIVAASGTALTAQVGKYYRFDAEVGTLAVTLPTPTDTTHLSNVILFLTTGSTPAITITSANVLYQDGYEIEAETTYEINCLFNGANWVIATMKIGGGV
jgi:hypothetical protein